VATALVVIFLVAPLYWLFVGSLQTGDGIAAVPPQLVPADPTLENYVQAFGQHRFGRYILNSIVVSATATAVVLGLGIFAGYALARMPIRGKTPILMGLLMISVFPVIAVVAPLYLMLLKLNWLNSYQGLIVPYVAFNLPFAIWILRNHFLDVPVALEESARIDGASNLRIVTKIIVPTVLPGIFTAGVFCFSACWQEFLMAISFNSSISSRTIPVGVALFSGEYTVPYGKLFAGSVAAVAPIMILVFAFRKTVASGLAAGAVKG
jgi:multiple sugar transport system permease protein